jgi:hypothetical protein
LPKVGAILTVGILIFSLALTGCSKKNGGGSGGADAGLSDLKEVAELTKTAADAAKALNSASGGKSSSGGGTASKAEDFKYDLSADGKGVVIQGLNGVIQGAPSGGPYSTVKIPEKIEGYPVVEIGAKALGQRMEITSVTIPNSVTKVGEMAFFSTGITTITLPSGITELGKGAFGASTELTKITLPSGITEIPEACFSSAFGLTSITIPNGVTRIGMKAFNGCESLKEVIIPESVTEIETGAFMYCSELTTVKLPSHPVKYSVNYLGGNDSFESCPKLSLAVRKAITDSGYTGQF